MTAAGVSIQNLAIAGGTALLLLFTKIPAPIIVATALISGVIL
jgi:hypothetical protein